MRIALVSEGTYPYAMGGVSVWCDQLIRGMPDYRWEMVRSPSTAPSSRLRRSRGTSTGCSRSRCGAPAAAAAAGAGAGRPARRSPRRTSRSCGPLVTPLDDPRPDRAAVNRSRFLLALRGLYEYAAGGGDLGAALTSNEALPA